MWSWPTWAWTRCWSLPRWDGRSRLSRCIFCPGTERNKSRRWVPESPGAGSACGAPTGSGTGSGNVGAPHAASANRRYRDDRRRARRALAPTCDRDGVGARPCLARSQSCQPGGSMGQPTAPARPVWMHGAGAPHAASANQRRRDDRRRARRGLAPTSGRT